MKTITKRRNFKELTEVAPQIYVIDGSLNSEFTDEVIERFASEPDKIQGAIGSGVNTAIKDSVDFWLGGSTSWEEEEITLSRELRKQRDAFCELNPGLDKKAKDWIFYCDTSYQIQKTASDTEGCHGYIPHVEAVCDNTIKRTLTFMWYLNDDFEGGNTEFLNQQVVVEPKKGRLVLFSPYWSHVHEGKPVTKDTKYIITGWIWSRGKELINE